MTSGNYRRLNSDHKTTSYFFMRTTLLSLSRGFAHTSNHQRSKVTHRILISLQRKNETIARIKIQRRPLFSIEILTDYK